MHLDGITRDGEIVPLSGDLGLRGRVLQVGWELPPDLSEPEWRAAGELLGKVERSVAWWLGDWWAFGETATPAPGPSEALPTTDEPTRGRRRAA